MMWLVFAEPYGITLRRPVTLKRLATDLRVFILGMGARLGAPAGGERARVAPHRTGSRRAGGAGGRLARQGIVPRGRPRGSIIETRPRWTICSEPVPGAP